LIQIEPWLIVPILIIIVGYVLVLRLRLSKAKWKIAFWLSFLPPVVAFFIAYILLTSGASSYPDPTRTEIQVFSFFYAAVPGILLSIVLTPMWIILGIKAFRKP